MLVYARDASEPGKQPRALEWLQSLWRQRTGRVSYQVLQEYYATVTGKLQPGLELPAARADVRALLAWNPVRVDGPILERAWGLQDRYGLSWWDAQIVAAAQSVPCAVLLTEDLQAGQRFGDLQVVDPFATDP